MRRVPFLLLALVIGGLAQKPPFDVNAMMKLARIGEPQVSPDGSTVAFTVTTVDVADNNRPRWSPDSKRIAYISDRGGSAQVWLMDPDGSNAKQVTSVSTEAGGVLFSPDGKNLVFTSDVYPQCGADDACNKKLLDAGKDNKVKA